MFDNPALAAQTPALAQPPRAIGERPQFKAVAIPLARDRIAADARELLEAVSHVIGL
jgi:hypothetical protein